MKRIALVTTLVLALAPAVFAQKHAEIGGFFDYTRLADTTTNFYGVGGRLGFGLAKHVLLEAEAAYDFEQSFTLTANGAGNPSFSATQAKVKILHGLFGPTVYFGPKAFHIFGTLKGGAINFSTSPGNFPQASQISDGNTYGVFYPGGGIELFAGPIGLRAEIGDEMWFANKTRNNLRITFGPEIRF
jgi:hypothetical protein